MFSKPRLVYVKLFGNSESRCNKNLFIFLFLVAEPSNVAEKKQKNKKNLFRRFGTIHKLWLLRDFSAVENSYTALLDNIIYMYRNYHFVFQSHLQQIVCVCVCYTIGWWCCAHCSRFVAESLLKLCFPRSNAPRLYLNCFTRYFCTVEHLTWKIITRLVV